MDTKILKPTQESIQLACDILKSGDVVAIPTETVYGLFADATKADACANIFKAKESPSDNADKWNILVKKHIYQISKGGESND